MLQESYVGSIARINSQLNKGKTQKVFTIHDWLIVHVSGLIVTMKYLYKVLENSLQSWEQHLKRAEMSRERILES